MKNKLIDYWKFNVKNLIKGYSALNGEDKEREIKQAKLMATSQILDLEKTGPNKEKSLRDQMNKEQLELLDYLEKVRETGNLEQ